MLVQILLPLYFMLPAFFANVAAHRLGGGTPVDFGRNFSDGKRFIGDGKTYNGLIGGIIVGMCTAAVQSRVYPSIYDDFNAAFAFGVIIASGAVFGDMAKSFFKRRMGIERGKPFILVDQSDFVWGALIFYYAFGRFVLEDFFSLPPSWLAVILLVSPLIHFAGNIIAYKLHMKDVWW